MQGIIVRRFAISLETCQTFLSVSRAYNEKTLYIVQKFNVFHLNKDWDFTFLMTPIYTLYNSNANDQIRAGYINYRSHHIFPALC
jgi:hypothetical protein